MNDEEITELVQSILVEQFEIEPEAITPEVKLADELGLDSIDAVDLIVRLKEHTGIKIPPEQFKNVVTLGDVIEILKSLK